MSAMEGANGQTEPAANGTTNGASNTSINPTPASSPSIEKRQIAIAQISSDLSNPSLCEIRGIITLLWPYSSLTKSIALNLAEPDVRLRSEKGQVKISFTGSLGKHIGAQGLGIDDQLVLSLEGAEFVKNTPRDSRDVGWELRYARILGGKITSRPTGDVVLNHEAKDEIETTPAVPVPVVVEVPSPPRSPPKNRVSTIQNDEGEWSSPAFIKRARLSYGSLMNNDFDNFIGEDGSIPGKGRKRAKFEPRKSGTWRYQSESRSPSPEPEKEDAVMAEPENPKPQMSEMGCQTDDLPYDEAAVQEFFRRSQAIGHDVRQDVGQNILQDEGVQTIFDGNEMLSPAPIPFHQPSTTPFGNPPVPLFAQYQIQPQGSTTPFGEPPAQSTTTIETLPEHYQSVVSPLAAKSKAPAHQEGQWPSSLFESMGYRPVPSLSKSITPVSSLRQLQQHKAFSPVAPMQSMQPSLQMSEQHNSAAMALEELSRIHQAQQFEDATVDYSDPSVSVLRGSLNEIAPALSPPRQSIQQSTYPELSDQEHAFLNHAKPQFSLRQQSRQQSSEPRSTQHSSKQSPASISYPADRHSRERSDTPAQGYTRARSGTPANRGASPADSIDLTGDSDEDNGHGEEYSQDEESDREHCRSSESFERTKERLLMEAEEESGGDEDRYERKEGEEENMTQIKIPSWRGQLSMIPKSSERVQDEDSNDDGDMYEGVSEEGNNEDEKMSDQYNSANRGVLLNPRPQRLSPTLNQEADVDEDADGDADEDARHYFSEPEQPASLQEVFSDDESDESGIEDYNSDANATLDPDNAIMPGEDTEEEWDEQEEEEEEESELEHDQEEYAKYEGDEEDMGPVYGHSGSQLHAASPPSGPLEVIDLLSSDDDEPAPLQKAALEPFPSSPASKPAAPIQQNDSGDEDKQLKVQADESMSEGEQEEIAKHQKEIYEEDKEIEKKYHEVGDMDHHSPTPPSAVVFEMAHDKLGAQEAESVSDADEGREDATEIAEQERQVYEDEVEDEIRSQEGHDREAHSPMAPTEEEAESNIGEEGSGYEDEDATAEEIEQPRDMVSMDGASESKHLTSSPAKRLFKNHPANMASSSMPEEVESVEAPVADEGAMADVEDFEVPKENFDAAKPLDPAILAEHDEDRPVPMGISVEVQDEDVALAHELADETHGESLVEASKSQSQEAAEGAQLAMAAILAERDEDRPVPMGVSAEVQDEGVAQAFGVAARDEDRPVQARPNAISGPSSPARAEAAQLALEDKLDREMEEDLRKSKDQELTQEAQRDIERAEVVPPARYDDGRQPQNELEQEIAQEMENVGKGGNRQTPVKAGVEPGPKGDPEDMDIDGDVGSDQELETFSDAETEPKRGEAVPSSPVVKAGVEPGPSGDPEDVDMDGDLVASDQELEAFSEADADAESVDEEPSPATVKSAVEPGPRGDPQDADMDGDIVESDTGFDANDSDTQMASSPAKVRPAVIIDVNAEVIVASDVDEAEDEDDYEDPSSQLFEEMSYIEQVEHTQALSTVEEVEKTTMADEETQETIDSQFTVSSNTHNSVWMMQQSQQTQESMEASVFSQVVQEETSFETVPALDAEAAVKEPGVEVPTGIEEVMESVPVGSKMLSEHLEQGRVAADDDEAMGDVEAASAKPGSHNKPSPTAPAKIASPAKCQAQVQFQPMAMEVDGHPASHTRSHDKDTEMKPQAVEMSIEHDEHPASHTRSHDKRVEKLQESDRSGSPAEHTRSHDALAGHCVEDDESAKGLQSSSRRKSSSEKSTEQATPSEAPGRAVTPVVEIPVSSAVHNVEETPPKRVTRSRRGTQESFKPASPPKTRKRALTPVVEVEVKASAASIEETAPERIEEEAAPEPPKRVTRSRQNTAEPENRSPPRTRKTRRKSLTPVVEVPASSLENVPEEAAPEPPKRTTRGRKAPSASVTKALTPPRTRRMSLRSQASPDTTNMTEESASVQLQAIDEEDDELPDPGAAALLEYHESPEKVGAKLSLTSAPAPAHHTRARGNASSELASSGQPVLETPNKARARALRSQSLSQGSAMTISQLGVGLAHETPNQSKDPLAETLLEATSPAAPMTPANKSFGTPLGSPSTWATLTPSAVAAQITKTLRTQLPAYTPLKNIKNHLKKKIDVIAVCVDTPVPAVKSKHTPHDYVLKFFVTEPGSIGTVKEVTAFHHFKKCLPEMRAGNVVLLRNFLVDGQNNGCLRSEKDSSWAVWRKDGEKPETKSDVPLEFEGEEDGYARQLKVWWEGKIELASKEKMKTLAQKAAGKK